MYKDTHWGIKKEGYCQADALGHYRVFTITDCSNKARYRLFLKNGYTKDVCGTHFKEYVTKDPITKKIIRILDHIDKVLDLKTDKIIWPNN